MGMRTLYLICVSLFYLSLSLISSSLYAQTPVSQITAGDLIDPNRDWGLSYFNLSAADASLLDDGAASWNLYQFFAFNYRFDWSRRISARVAFSTQTPGAYDSRGNVRSFDTKGNDFHIVYNDFNTAELPGEWDLSSAYYLYLPTSENSRNRRWIARVRAWYNFETKLNRKTLFAIWVKPEYFFNTQKAFRRETFNTAADGSTFFRVSAANNTRATLETSAVTTYALNSTLSPQLSFGFTQTWMEDSSQLQNQTIFRDSLTIQLASWININRQLRFLAGIGNEIGLTNRSTPKTFRLFHPEENQIYVLTFWNLF